MPQKASAVVPQLAGPVRITIPAAVANNVGALKETITNIAERIGCRTCFSGADCVFQQERELVVDGPQQVRSAATLFSSGPNGEPAVGFGRTVTVNMSAEIGHNLEQVLSVVDTIAARIKAWPGHLACCSGFDIAFREELSLVSVDKERNVSTFGPAFGG